MMISWAGEEYKWNFAKNRKRAKRGSKSYFHCRCREILAEKYKLFGIYEEVTIPGLNLYADFFVTLPLIVEVHGKQHYEFTPHFHGSLANFLKSQKRDKDKKKWAEANNIQYVELPYNKEDEWEQMLP